jgi:septal ring factor EnvC (AmiA/AmiB activator)
MNVALSRLLWCGLALAMPAWAAQAPTAKGGVQQKQVDQAISTQQVEVKRLQGDVQREEGRTHQADEKLKQQDQQIADLQRQLKALQAAQQGNGHP